MEASFIQILDHSGRHKTHLNQAPDFENI